MMVAMQFYLQFYCKSYIAHKMLIRKLRYDFMIEKLIYKSERTKEARGPLVGSIEEPQIELGTTRKKYVTSQYGVSVRMEAGSECWNCTRVISSWCAILCQKYNGETNLEKNIVQWKTVKRQLWTIHVYQTVSRERVKLNTYKINKIVFGYIEHAWLKFHPIKLYE